MTNDLNSFANFKKVNAPKQVAGADYLSAMHKALALPDDFLLEFSRLLWPDFRNVNGSIFVEVFFDEAQYESLHAQGHSDSSVQFWAGLIEITGIFDIALTSALEIANKLAVAWNSKLASDGGDSTRRFRVIQDESTQEVFIAIGSPD